MQDNNEAELAENKAEFAENETASAEAEAKSAESEAEDEALAAAQERERRAAEKNSLVQKNALLFRRIKAALGAAGLFAGYFVFPEFFFLFFSRDTLQNSGTVKILASVMGFFVYFACVLSYYVKRSDKTGEMLGDIIPLHPREISAKPAAVCVLLGMALNLTSSSLLALLPIPEEWLSGYSSSSQTLLQTDSLAVSILYIALLAPLCEELMFRGLIFHRIRSGFSVTVSVIVTSVAFALPHINPLWIAVAVLNSLVFTMVRERSGNLCYTIILHSCYNLVSVPMILLNGTEAYNILFDSIAAEIIYLVGGGAAVYFCTRYLLLRREENGDITYQIYSGGGAAKGVDKK